MQAMLGKNHIRCSFMLAVLLMPFPGAVQAAQSGNADDAMQAWVDGQPAAAVAIWQARAQQGDARAQQYLGYLYRRGKAVQADQRRAAQYYRLAAEQGVAAAQYELGLMYELGVGMPVDPEEAEYWYGLAVGQGFCPGELSAGGELGD